MTSSFFSSSYKIFPTRLYTREYISSKHEVPGIFSLGIIVLQENITCRIWSANYCAAHEESRDPIDSNELNVLFLHFVRDRGV